MLNCQFNWIKTAIDWKWESPDRETQHPLRDLLLARTPEHWIDAQAAGQAVDRGNTQSWRHRRRGVAPSHWSRPFAEAFGDEWQSAMVRSTTAEWSRMKDSYVSSICAKWSLPQWSRSCQTNGRVVPAVTGVESPYVIPAVPCRAHEPPIDEDRETIDISSESHSTELDSSSTACDTDLVVTVVDSDSDVSMPDLGNLPDPAQLPDQATLPDLVNLQIQVHMPERVNLPDQVLMADLVNLPDQLHMPDPVDLSDQVHMTDLANLPDQRSVPDLVNMPYQEHLPCGHADFAERVLDADMLDSRKRCRPEDLQRIDPDHTSKKDGALNSSSTPTSNMPFCTTTLLLTGVHWTSTGRAHPNSIKKN